MGSALGRLRLSFLLEQKSHCMESAPKPNFEDPASQTTLNMRVRKVCPVQSQTGTSLDPGTIADSGP